MLSEVSPENIDNPSGLIFCNMACVLGLKARLRIFLRFVLTPRLEKVIPEKLRESEVKMKTKVVASKSTLLL